MAFEITHGPRADFSGDCDQCGAAFRCAWTDRRDDDDGKDKNAILVVCPACDEDSYAFRDEAGRTAA